MSACVCIRAQVCVHKSVCLSVFAELPDPAQGMAVPGAERDRGAELLLEVRGAEGVAQGLVQVDAGLGQEVGRVGELHRGARHQGRAGHGRAVAGGTHRTQAGRSTWVQTDEEQRRRMSLWTISE